MITILQEIQETYSLDIEKSCQSFWIQLTDIVIDIDADF